MNICFRLSDNRDPEERLEEACLWKSFYDEFGSDIELIDTNSSVDDDSILIGRSKSKEFDLIQTDFGMRTDYWNFDIFKEYSNREHRVVDWSEAMNMAKSSCSSKNGIFLKSILKQKHFTCAIPAGDSIYERVGDMAYSFIDKGDCLLVQELKNMEFERRFFVVDRQIVTHSPVAFHITPLDRIHNSEIEHSHFDTPGSRSFNVDKKLTSRFLDTAKDIAQNMSDSHATFDLCLIDDKISLIEFNPIKVGMLGNFAMDTRKIAESSRSLIRDVKLKIEEDRSSHYRM